MTTGGWRRLPERWRTPGCRGGKVARHGQGHGDDRTLRRGVRNHRHLTVERADRGGLDDHPTLAVDIRLVLGEGGGRQAGEVERTADVELEVGEERFLGQHGAVAVDERPLGMTTPVALTAIEKVPSDRARAMARRRRHRRCCHRRRGHRSRARRRAPRRVLVGVQDDDAGAGGDEAANRSAAEAAGSASNDADRPCEVHRPARGFRRRPARRRGCPGSRCSGRGSRTARRGSRRRSGRGCRAGTR